MDGGIMTKLELEVEMIKQDLEIASVNERELLVARLVDIQHEIKKDKEVIK
jgi:hypothetical protein